jgi:hypothetical protein
VLLKLANWTINAFTDSSRQKSIAWLFELAGGAIADSEDTCVPKSQREAHFTIAALHQWEIDVYDDRCVDSAEEVCPRTLF